MEYESWLAPLLHFFGCGAACKFVDSVRVPVLDRFLRWALQRKELQNRNKHSDCINKLASSAAAKKHSNGASHESHFKAYYLARTLLARWFVTKRSVQAGRTVSRLSIKEG